MADLFSGMETPETVSTPEQPKKLYRNERGRFTDKDSAWRAELTKECARLKTVSEYYKRQTKRLSAEYKAEHELRLKAEARIKELTVDS